MTCLLPAPSIVGGILTDSNNKSYVAQENKIGEKRGIKPNVKFAKHETIAVQALKQAPTQPSVSTSS